MGLIIGIAIGIAGSAIADASLVSGSVINQMATSPILNTLFVQGITDVINIGLSVGVTLLRYHLLKREFKVIKKWFTNFWNNIKNGRISPIEDLPYYDPGVSPAPLRPNIPSFGGGIDHHGDDGDDSWNILDDPY